MKESDFFNQLSLLLKAGFPLDECFKSLADSFSNKTEHFHEIQRHVENGLPLSQALRNTGKYDKHTLDLVEVAEKDDSLSETCMTISRYSHLQWLIIKLVKDTAIYPAIVLTTLLVAIGIMSRYAMTDFQSLYNDLLDGEPLPSLTESFMTVGSFVNNYFITYNVLILTFIVTVILIFTGKLKIPILSNVSFQLCSLWTDLPKNFNSSKLCSFLALHLDKKAELIKVFSSASTIVADPYMKSDLKRAANHLSEGMSLRDSLDKMYNVDPMIKHTLYSNNTSQISGNLNKLAEMYYEKSYLMSRRLTLIWEVLLILVVALLTLTTFVAMLMPMMTLMGCMC